VDIRRVDGVVPSDGFHVSRETRSLLTIGMGGWAVDFLRDSDHGRDLRFWHVLTCIARTEGKVSSIKDKGSYLV